MHSKSIAGSSSKNFFHAGNRADQLCPGGSFEMHYLEPQERECNVMTAKTLNNAVGALAGRGSSQESALLVGIVIRVWPQDLHRNVQETETSNFVVASGKFPPTGARPKNTNNMKPSPTFPF